MVATAPTNVLIIEPDLHQTEMTRELIKDIGRIQIDTTDSGERAIELVSRMPYQLVIADSGIADMDILSILERVKRVSPITSVILTSSFGSIEEAVRAMRSGADDYFIKPYNPEHFKLAVRQCVNRRVLYTGDNSVASLMMLLNTCQLISGYMEEAKVLEAVTGYLKRETNCKGIALFRLTAEGHTRIPTAVDLDPEVVEVLVDAQRLFASDGEDNQVVRFIPKSGATSDSLIFQFHSVEEARYAVVAISPTLSSSFEEISSQLRLLDAQVQMTSRTIQAYKGVKGLIYVDEPTGLHNTRFFHKTLESLFERWDARNPDSSQGFSVLFLDVDKFKLVNDKHGHLVGTKILFEMAQIIRRCIRKTDFAFRYGGDEFVMILDGAKTSVAGLIAERIRSEVEHAEFLAREGLHIRLTVSIGVANCPEHAVTKKEIIEAADNAMYSVKRTTRNRVYIPEKQAA